MGKKENDVSRMTKQVAAYIRKFHMINPGEKVLIGLSGGADSVCLFFLLLSLREELEFTFEAVHVNHCMRDSAGRDEEFVKLLCREHDILLHSFKVDVQAVARRDGLSPEEAGRNIRYECFAQVMERTGATKVAVAHHQVDQAETMLFHLIRGSGVDGMAGIKPVRDYVIRPLLCLGRSEIETYLAEQGRVYMTDETNASTQYSRNKLRHEVIPVLEEVCAGATGRMALTGESFSELSDYLHKQVYEALTECADVSEKGKGCIRLCCDKLSDMHVYMQGEVIRECIYLLAGNKKDISRTHVEAVKGLLDLQVGRKIDLPYGILAEKSYNTLIFRGEERQREELCETDFCVRVAKEDLESGIEVKLPDGKIMKMRMLAYRSGDVIPTKSYTKWMDCDKIEGTIEIRTPKEEDFFYFNHKNKKYVKDYMVDEKIPMAERGKSILVADGSHMLYFVGKRISNGVLIDETTRKILEITVTGG